MDARSSDEHRPTTARGALHGRPQIAVRDIQDACPPRAVRPPS
ncbi:hypothetical protein [Streptomyces sp. yr375]|nr:hypothetical protein [Streptomyces sp. yr375]